MRSRFVFHTLIILSLRLIPFGIQSTRAQETPVYDVPLFTGPVHEAPASSFDQEHVRLALRFEPDGGRIFGVVKIRLNPSSDTLRTLTLDAEALDIYTVRAGIMDSLKKEATYSDSLSGRLIVSLDSLQMPGVPFEVEISYSAAPKRGLLFRKANPRDTTTSVHIWTQNDVNNHRYWLPMIRNQADRVTSEIIATVPPPLKVLSNGRLIEQVQTEDGMSRYYYVQDQLHPPQDIGLIVGYFDQEITNVRLHNSFNVTINQWLPFDDREKAELSFLEVPAMLYFFSEKLDFTYPWPSYTQLVFDDLLIDDMSFTGFTVFNDRVLNDRRAMLDDDGALRLASALARQWFGHLIQVDHWADAWITESLSLFMGLMYVRETQGEDVYAIHLAELEKAYQEESSRYKRPLVWNRWEDEFDLQDAHARGKGVWILHSLYQQMGAEAFWNAIKIFTSRYAFNTTNTDEFLAAIDASESQTFAPFFDEWVYSAGHPAFEIKSQYDVVSETLYVAVDQVQEGYLVPPVYNLDMVIETYTLAGPERHAIHLDERDQLISIPMPIQPRYVLLDPDCSYLSDIDNRQSPAGLIAQLRYASSPLRQLDALRQLHTFADDPALLIGLQSALGSRPDPAVRAGIIELIALLPPSDATRRTILEAYGNDDSPLVKRAVLKALESFETHEDLIQIALDAAQNAQSYRLQAQAVETLARIGAPSARDIVQSALITPSHREVVRGAALRGLSYAGFSTQEQIRIATQYLAPKQPAEVRIAAIDPLRHLAGLDNRRSMTTLKDLLSDDDARVRRAALEAIGQVGADDELEALQKYLNAEQNPRLIRAAREAVRQIETRLEKTASME